MLGDLIRNGQQVHANSKHFEDTIVDNILRWSRSHGHIHSFANVSCTEGPPTQPMFSVEEEVHIHLHTLKSLAVSTSKKFQSSIISVSNMLGNLVCLEHTKEQAQSALFLLKVLYLSMHGNSVLSPTV